MGTGNAGREPSKADASNAIDNDSATMPLTSLIPDPRNARRHTERNLGLIVDALREVGAARSIVIDETGTILAGNATVAAAGKAGIDRVRIVEADGAELIAVRRSGLTPEQKRRLALLDNRAAELAEWDTEVLASLAEDTDLSGLWEPDELAELLASAEAPAQLLGDPDDVPDLPADSVTQPGDLWLLGSHRLLCGDATTREDLDRLMAGERAACLWTDPPYGVSYVGRTKDALTLANDDAAGLEGLLRASLANVTDALVPGAAFYIAHPAGPLSLIFLQVVTDLGWKLRQTLVWVKDRLVLGHSDYHYLHEPILYGVLPGGGRRGRGAAGWYGDDAQTSVFEIARPCASPDHPTSKPVSLVAGMLGNSTKRGDVVLDPFGGSGSTLIACEQLRQQARLLELDPRYCDVVVNRWEALTGQTAERVCVQDRDNVDAA
jgi:DNA modification methylase